MTSSLIVVIGDVHHHIGLAAEGLERIETDLGRPISQVFSVGDLGLFVDEGDWAFLTGPKKYRCPEDSKMIRDSWEAWRWPLSAIAGNHEPFHRLRDWDASHFSNKLEYTNAGELAQAATAAAQALLRPDALRFQDSDKLRVQARVHRRLWESLSQSLYAGATAQ